jgi:heptosyltransferase-2
MAGFFARNGELEKGLADYFAGFDLIISFLYDPDKIFQTNVARCTRAQFIPGPHRPDESAGIHATQTFLKPLERLAIFDADPVPRLGLPKQVSPLNQIALHPGSGSEEKNWPEEKWAELLEHLLHSTRFDLLLVGGEAETDRLQRLAAALPISRVRVAQNLPLPELASRLHECAAFVGHDSGISHLAAAVGLPGILLWGKTSETVWKPHSEKVITLKATDGLASLPVATVLKAVREVEIVTPEKAA